MPLGKSLPDTEIAVLEKWIRGLKPDVAEDARKKYWAFVKPGEPSLPSVRDAAAGFEIPSITSLRASSRRRD